MLKLPSYEEEVRLITWIPMYISALLVRMLKHVQKKTLFNYGSALEYN
jgi:hypothetical protein